MRGKVLQKTRSPRNKPGEKDTKQQVWDDGKQSQTRAEAEEDTSGVKWKKSPIDGLPSSHSVGKRKWCFPSLPTVHCGDRLLWQFDNMSTTGTRGNWDRDQGPVSQAHVRFQSKQAKWPTSAEEVSGEKLAPKQALSLDGRSRGPYRRGSDAPGRQPRRRPTLILKERILKRGGQLVQ